MSNFGVIRDAATGATAGVAARAQTPEGSAMQVQIGPGDVISNIPIVLDYAHHQVHEGETWQAGYGPIAIANNAVVDHLIIVAAVTGTIRTPHVVIELDSTGETWLELYESPTTTANGTGVTCYNRNRNTAGSPTTTIYVGPTVTATGTKLMGQISGSGEKAGGSSRDSTEWDLKTSVHYLVRITAKNANNVCLRFQFYEDQGV